MYIEIYRYLHPLGIYAPTYVEVYLYFLNVFIENSSTFIDVRRCEVNTGVDHLPNPTQSAGIEVECQLETSRVPTWSSS